MVYCKTARFQNTVIPSAIKLSAVNHQMDDSFVLLKHCVLLFSIQCPLDTAFMSVSQYYLPSVLSDNTIVVSVLSSVSIIQCQFYLVCHTTVPVVNTKSTICHLTINVTLMMTMQVYVKKQIPYIQ